MVHNVWGANTAQLEDKWMWRLVVDDFQWERSRVDCRSFAAGGVIVVITGKRFYSNKVIHLKVTNNN